LLGKGAPSPACLGVEVEGRDEGWGWLSAEGFKAMIERAAAAYPNFQVIATTLRGVKTATVNDWSAIAWSRSGGFAESARRPGLEILDRVGGGDSFAAGLIFGLLRDLGLPTAGEYAAAHGARSRRRPGRARHDPPRRHPHRPQGGSRQPRRRRRRPCRPVAGATHGTSHRTRQERGGRRMGQAGPPLRSQRLRLVNHQG